jgi:glucose-1-phosphate thymidylyltransferase
MIRTAVIMAAGRGTRMQRADDRAPLNAAQAAAADAGHKAMMPIGRPFLEYVISALADAGITHVVLVVGPSAEPMRQHFTVDARPARVRIDFAEQPDATGTADAVVRAAAVAGDVPFLVLNADNYYPVDAFRALAADDSAGTVAFDRDALVTHGNIDRERVRAFAVLDIDPRDMLRGIIEKPGDALDLDAPAARWVGMNLWAITPAVVDACRRVPRSVRGEFELPEAVALAIREGTSIRTVRMAAPVLDLSRRSDIASVTAHLAGITPRL